MSLILYCRPFLITIEDNCTMLISLVHIINISLHIAAAVYPWGQGTLCNRAPPSITWYTLHVLRRTVFSCFTRSLILSVRAGLLATLERYDMSNKAEWWLHNPYLTFSCSYNTEPLEHELWIHLHWFIVDNHRSFWSNCNSMPLSLKWQLIYVLPNHRINDSLPNIFGLMNIEFIICSNATYNNM